MAEYPDWVLKYKQKGTYINKVGNKYYLYAAHSERVPGTNKARRIYDGIIGRITEEDGLVPSSPKAEKEVLAYEYGMTSLVMSVCQKVYENTHYTFGLEGDFIMSAALLWYVYGFTTKDRFSMSWLSLAFPWVQYPSDQHCITSDQVRAIQRVHRNISGAMKRRFHTENDENKAIKRILSSFSLVLLLSSDGNMQCTAIPDDVAAYIRKYSLDWSPDMWKKYIK